MSPFGNGILAAALVGAFVLGSVYLMSTSVQYRVVVNLDGAKIVAHEQLFADAKMCDLAALVVRQLFAEDYPARRAVIRCEPDLAWPW